MFASGNDKMEKAINQMKKEFSSIRTGRANPMILDKVLVEYYGAPTPLRQLSQVSVQDGTTLVIAPYDKTILKDIEKEITEFMSDIDGIIFDNNDPKFAGRIQIKIKKGTTINTSKIMMTWMLSTVTSISIWM